MKEMKLSYLKNEVVVEVKDYSNSVTVLRIPKNSEVIIFQEDETLVTIHTPGGLRVIPKDLLWADRIPLPAMKQHWFNRVNLRDWTA